MKSSAFYSIINDFRLKKPNKNVVWLILLYAVTGASQILLYFLLNRLLGIEYIGVWALIVASTSIGQISSFGFSASLIRILPELILKNHHDKITKTIGTINLSNFLLSFPLLGLLYFPIQLYAHSLLSGQKLFIFNSVIIWSLLGVFINNLFSVYSFLFDGFQKFYIRCMIQISGWAIFALLIFFLIPAYGLKGVGIAFLLQSVWQLCLGIFMTARYKIIKFGFVLCFDREAFTKVSIFGSKSQLISVMVIFFDPVIKYFITKTLGLSGIVNYELANKITVQIRYLLGNVNLTLTPKIVEANSRGEVEKYFTKASSRNIFISVGLGMMILFLSPIAIYLFKNKFDETLLSCIAIINVGWVCNIITTVHYNTCIALNKMNGLLLVHASYVLTAIILYFALSHFKVFYFIYFVVPSISLFVGSLLNSYLISKEVKPYNWVYSPFFLLFIFESFVISFFPIHSVLMLFLLSTSFILIFYYIYLKKREVVFH